MKTKKEGYIKVPGGKVWYKMLGRKNNIPLIVIHGGPGYPHDYLEPLKDLSLKRKVIFYDQLGCGKSERPDDLSLWSVDRFVLELKAVIKFLNFRQYHILGHSWGAALAVSFALTKPSGLTSIVLADPYISTPLWEKDAKRLIKLLPKRMQQAIKKYEKDKIYSQKYKMASKEFYQRFLRRMDPLPKAFMKMKEGKNDKIYNFMWGPEEYWVTGTLKDFDPTKRLSEITTPTLLLCGRYDEATPESTSYFQSLLPNGKFVVFEESAHHPYWNEREKFMTTVNNFLEKTRAAPISQRK